MNLSTMATRSFGSTSLFMRNNSPAILTGAGVIGFIATTALTIRSTTKALDAMPKISEDINESKMFRGSENARKKQVVAAYATSSLKMAEIYWPPLLVGSASIICVLAGHGLMQRRQASLVAAYTALDAGYKAYRSRIRQAFGEENELKVYRGEKFDFKEMPPPCEIIDEEDAFAPASPYARFFDEYNKHWVKTAEYNSIFLRSQQNWANDRLQAYGYLFLNDVYEALGIERSQAGQSVGWLRNGNGDGFVDFGLDVIYDETSRAFTNGQEPSVLLDFNVDGPILIPRRSR
jgi:hypothetical protein